MTVMVLPASSAFATKQSQWSPESSTSGPTFSTSTWAFLGRPAGTGAVLRVEG